MKSSKFISLISLIFFQLQPFASWNQAVFAPIKGAKWTYIYNSFSFFNGVMNRTNGVIKATYLKDTIVEGKDYKLILLNYGSVDSSNNSVRISYSNKFMTRQAQDTIWGFMNDKINERVYFIFKQIPDSFTIKKLQGTDVVSKKVFIDTIRTMQYSNRNFKIWKGKSYYQLLADGCIYDTFNLTFAERIGPIDDVLPYFATGWHPGCIDKRYKYGLVCYEDSEIGTIKFMDLDCNIVPVEDISDNLMFKTYFDNINRNIEIHFEDGNINQWELSLINISGQVILTTILKDTHNSISVPKSLPSGIYITYLHNKSNEGIVVKKIFIY